MSLNDWWKHDTGAAPGELGKFDAEVWDRMFKENRTMLLKSQIHRLWMRGSEIGEQIGKLLERSTNRRWWQPEIDFRTDLNALHAQRDVAFENLFECIEDKIRQEVAEGCANLRGKVAQLEARIERLTPRPRFVGGPLDGQRVPDNAPDIIFVRGWDPAAANWTCLFEAGRERGPKATVHASDVEMGCTEWEYVKHTDLEWRIHSGKRAK